MRKLTRLAAAQSALLSDPAFAELAASALLIRLPKGSTIYRAGDPQAALYEVVEGGVRTLLARSGGGEIVSGLRGAGALFGLAAAGRHIDSAETVAPTILRLFEREDLARFLPANAAAAIRLFEIACAELGARAEQLSLVSRSDALGRLALFLRIMAADGEERGTVWLAMSRGEIARFIGLSNEAVSRGFRALAERGAIAVRYRRQLDLLDPAKLDEIISTRPRRTKNSNGHAH
jgi:CRP/FNR family transcriptional regulator, cyclic AMP receptor protein